MKKLFFTLAICLFSMGAFASSAVIEKSIIMSTKEIPSALDQAMRNKCTYTVIITIDHGENFDPTVITYTYRTM